MSTNKKITVAVVVVVLLVFGLFLFLEFGEQTTDPEQPEQEGPIFPFATTSEFFTGEDGGIDIDDQPSEPSEEPDLWKISDDPVAGSGWVSTSTDTDNEHVWFIKRATGLVFSANPESRDVRQLTDTEIPQVRDAIVSPDGQTIIYRYLNDQDAIQTYKATLSTSSEDANVPYTVSGSFLPTDIYEIALSPDGSQLFYLRASNNQSIGIVYNLSSDSQQQVFSSDVSDWRVNFSQPNTVTLYTPPADGVNGYAYELNLQNGQKTKVAEGESLSIKTNVNGARHLSTTQDDNTFTTKPLTGTTSDTTANTFVDKCSWADTDIFFCGVPDSTTPSSITAWYQGRQQFQDNLLIFNTEDSSREQLFDSDQVEKANADIVDIAISNDFFHSVFTNRSNGDLWGYDL